MKKCRTFVFALMLSSTFSFAQQVTIDLPYSISREITNDNKWPKWTNNYINEKEVHGFTPNVTIQKMDDEVYKVSFYYGGSASGMFEETVVYDPNRTKKMREQNKNDKLYCYRYTRSNDYLMTDRINIVTLLRDPSKWKTTQGAKIFNLENSQGSQTVYTYKPAVIASDKYKVSFTGTKSKVKGSWTDFSAWKSVPSNSYFVLHMIERNKRYIIKYYENGKLSKNYKITYDPKVTTEQRKTHKGITYYSIDGRSGEHVVLRNTSMSSILGNPDRWSENNAEVYFFDSQETQTRFK